MQNLSLMIVGVGGQGTLLASRVLGAVAVRMGLDVKMSEVHGMSQRGGSVVTYVKFGDIVYSPLIEPGEADVILAFEELEALRWIPYLRKGGRILANGQKINPMPVIMGKAKYPEEIFTRLRSQGTDITSIDALALAKEAGSGKAVNVVLIGLLARMLGYTKEFFIEALYETIPPRLLDINLKAFESGYTAVNRYRS